MFPARGPKIFNKLLLLLAMAGPLYGQNTTRMNSGVNAQTVSPYTVVCSDALKLVTLNSASAFAVNLPSAATCGAGYVFQLKNLGAGLVTITPLFGTIDGSSSITLSTGSGIDVYNNGTNYFTQSGSSTGSMDSILAGLAFQKNTFNSGQVSIYNGNFETGPTWGALTDTGPLPNPAWGNPIAGSQAIPGWLWSSGNLLCVTPSYETTTQYPNKNRSLKQIFNSCGTGGGALNQSFWQVQPGDTYYIRASMKTSGITGYACVRFIDKTTTGSPGVFPGDGSVCATTSSASWVTVSATGTVPANMVYGILNLFFPPSGPAGTVWYDNIQVFRVDHSAGQTIYDGASSGSAALGAASVAGTPNRINLPTITGTNGQCLQTDGANPQQTSWGTCAAITMDTIPDGPAIYVKHGAVYGPLPIVYNGDFEASTTLPPSDWLPNPNATCSYETIAPYEGLQSLKCLSNTDGAGAGVFTSVLTPVTPGETFYVRGAVKSDGVVTANVALRWLDKTKTATSVFPGDALVASSASGSWTLVSATGVVPSNAVFATIDLVSTPFGIAGTTWYDFISAYRVSYPPGQTIYGGTTSGSAALGAASVAGTPNRINLPTITGTNGQCLQTDGANPQQASWGTCGVAGSNTQVQFNDSAVFGATADFTFTKGTGQVNIGSAGGKTGTVKLTGITSGSATIGVADAAGTPNKVLLPTTTGTSGYLLQTDGGNPQQLSWVSNGVGGLMTTLGDMIYENASPAAARLAGPTTPNSVAQILTNTPSAGAAATPVWALPGVPTNAQTGTTYTIAVTDRASYVTFSNAGAIAVTLPSAASAGFGSNFVVVACDIGAGTATITPTTSTISYSTGSAYTAAASSLALTTGQCAWIYSDNTNYFAIQRTGGAPVYPVSVSGTVTSGGIPYFNSTTQSSSSAILNTNILVKGGGAGGAPTNSSITDNGTTISTAEAISTTSTVSTGSSAPACTAGTSGLICMTEGTDGTNVASTGLINPNSTQHEFTAFTNGATGASSQGMLVRTQPGRIHSAGNTAAISTATLCASAAGACNTAGLYTVDWAFTQGGTACGNVTAGGVTFLLTWTDANAVAHSAISLAMDDSASLLATTGTFHFTTNNATAWASGTFNIYTNGSIIQYATGYTACTTGTGNYNLDITVTRKGQT